MCYYCPWSGEGDASIHRAIFGHEAKVLYGSSNGGLNSPDSCTHCLVTLCVKKLCPSPLCASTNNFWVSLFAQSGTGLSSFSPSRLACVLFLIPSVVNLALITQMQRSVKNELSRWDTSHLHYNGKSPPLSVTGSSKCAKGQTLPGFPCKSKADFQQLHARSRFSFEQVTTWAVNRKFFVQYLGWNREIWIMAA